MSTIRALVPQSVPSRRWPWWIRSSVVLNRLPTSVTTGLFGAALRGIDVVASNVPGAPIELFTAGARINSMFALGPLAGSAVNVTLLSYLDQVHIGINLDPAAVTEPERFVAATAPDGTRSCRGLLRPEP